LWSVAPDVSQFGAALRRKVEGNANSLRSRRQAHSMARAAGFQRQLRPTFDP